MEHLPLKKLYHNGEMACRFLKPPIENDYLVMTIPGGPGLSGTYLDSFLMQLANRTNMNVGILDLPDHGKSNIKSKENILLYKDCLKIIEKTIYELSKDYPNLILFGQSFGARLAFDLLSVTEVNILGLLLTGFPHKFEHSEYLLNKMKSFIVSSDINSDSEVEDFYENIKRRFSLYTIVEFPKETLLKISSEPDKEEHNKMLEEVMPITISTELILKNKSHVPIKILEGDSDFVVPDNNLLELKKIIPQASYTTIKTCGHFVMVEKLEETLNIFSSFLSSITINNCEQKN